MKPLVTGGEDRVIARVEPYTVVPARARPFGAGCIHVAYQVRVVGDQQVGADATRRSWRACVSIGVPVFEGGTRQVGVVVSGRFTMLLQGFELGDIDAGPARLIKQPRATGFCQQRASEVSQQTPVGEGVQAGVGEE
jgi:hypothetical protein